MANSLDSPVPKNCAAAMLRRAFDETPEFLVMLEMAMAFLSVPCAVIILSTVLRHGTTTPFAPSDLRSHWVEGPSSRGTINIIWLCASTIYTCVHVSVHIDVLNLDRNYEDFTKDVEKRNQRFPQWMKTFIITFMKATKSRWVRHAVWICFNIFAPEVVVLVAVLEYFSARDGKRFMVSCGQKDWDMTLAFYADMGGFGQSQPQPVPAVADKDENDTISIIGTGDDGIDHARHFRSGREFMEWYQEESQASRGFSQNQLKLIQAEIKDRSDESLLLKLLTATQASWLFVETMVRLAEPNHAVSQMEITTCAYIFCTLITYLCWLKKPYHISGHIILPERLPLQCPSDSLGKETPTSPGKEIPTMLWDKARFTPFNRSFARPIRSWILASTSSGVVGALVGAIHGAPLWKARFINTHGQWLWRTGSIIQFAFPLLVSSSALVEQLYSGTALLLVAALLSFIYAISRFILFGLVWLSFWSLPSSVYHDIDWSWSYFPHWH